MLAAEGGLFFMVTGAFDCSILGSIVSIMHIGPTVPMLFGMAS